MTIRRSGNGQLPVWFGIPFLLGGLFVAAMGVVLFQDEQRYGREGVAVEGSVVETVYHSGGEDGPSYSIRYEFVDPVTGVRHAGESDVSEETYETSNAGDPIEVTYLPAEPTKSRIGSPEPQLFIPFAVLGAGALFSIVGIGLTVLVLRIRRHGQPSWLHMTPEATDEREADNEPISNAIASFFSDEEAPGARTASAASPAPPAPDRPLSAEELRALDARLGAKPAKPDEGAPPT